MTAPRRVELHASRGREAGFTLLELLVALSVLAVLMTLMFGGLRFGVRVWESGESSLRGLADLQTAAGFIRRQIVQSIPRSLPGEQGNIDATSSFRGAPDALKLIGLAPSRLLPGGLYEIAVGLDGGGRNGAYRLSAWWRPVDRSPGRDQPSIDQDERTRQVVLLDGVAALRMSYFGQGDDINEPPRWNDRWEGMLTPPTLVSVKVDFPPGDARAWPELVVAPVASTEYQ